MFRKYSILIWLCALLVLVGIYLLVEYTSSEDRTFRSKVITLEPGLITALNITDMEKGIKTEIRKEGDAWKIYSGGKAYVGDGNGISQSLELLSNLSTESVVATKSDKWVEYKVDEDQAIIIELFEGDDMLERAFIGKFGFKQIPSPNPGQQPQVKMTSYIRPEEDEKVYAVDGLIRTNFEGGKDALRSRWLVPNETYSDFTRITINRPGNQVLLDLSTPEWNVNGLPLDSTKTDRYLRSLARLNNSGFLDEVDVSNMKAAYTMLIEGTTFDPITLSAYPADSVTGYYITSSINEGTVFDGSKNGLFEKTFVGPERFLEE